MQRGHTVQHYNFYPTLGQVLLLHDFISSLVILANLLILGVQLVAPNQLNTIEGERQQLCVAIQDDDPARERSVGITFRLYPMGKCNS